MTLILRRIHALDQQTTMCYVPGMVLGIRGRTEKKADKNPCHLHESPHSSNKKTKSTSEIYSTLVGKCFREKSV